MSWVFVGWPSAHHLTKPWIASSALDFVAGLWQAQIEGATCRRPAYGIGQRAIGAGPAIGAIRAAATGATRLARIGLCRGCAGRLGAGAAGDAARAAGIAGPEAAAGATDRGSMGIGGTRRIRRRG